MPAIKFDVDRLRIYDPPTQPRPLYAHLDVAVPGRYMLTAWHPEAWAALDAEERDELTPVVAWVGGYAVIYERVGPVGQSP